MTGAPTRATRTPGVRFVGSGSKCFRIWIVKLLLTVVTLGFYHPFAKGRRPTYFHGCTEVDGQAPDFQAKPWAMLRGCALVVALSAVYALARHVCDTAGGVALLAMMAIGSALWWSSLRFRLAHTRRRGVPLHLAAARVRGPCTCTWRAARRWPNPRRRHRPRPRTRCAGRWRRCTGPGARATARA